MTGAILPKESRQTRGVIYDYMIDLRSMVQDAAAPRQVVHRIRDNDFRQKGEPDRGIGQIMQYAEPQRLLSAQAPSD